MDGSGQAPLKPTPLDAWCARRLGLAGRALHREALERAQLKALQATVAWARERSLFYRGRVPEAPLASLRDVRLLPFTTAAELRAQGPRMLCVSQDEVARVVTLNTSGTTGPSKRVFLTEGDQQAILDFFVAGMSTFVGPGERVVVYLPGAVGELLARALPEALQVEVVSHGLVREVSAAFSALVSTRPTSLVALPVHALALARFALERTGRPPLLKAALLTADAVPAPLRREVERGLGCRVFEHYGMTEMGLGGGVECEAHCGYHLREADLLFEVVDPATGATVPDGVPGEVVFTTLGRRAMPLLRYRTGDLAWTRCGPCRCGGVTRRLGRVRGRLAAARTPEGLGLADLDEVLFACPGVVDFEAEVRDGRLVVTVFTLGKPGAALEQSLRALAQLPGAELALASLDGVLASGPAKRALRVRGEAADAG